MTQDNLDTIVFMFYDELEEWKIVKHAWNNVSALRSCGRLVKCESEDDAEAAIKRFAAQNLIRAYHMIQGKTDDNRAQFESECG